MQSMTTMSGCCRSSASATSWLSSGPARWPKNASTWSSIAVPAVRSSSGTRVKALKSRPRPVTRSACDADPSTATSWPCRASRCPSASIGGTFPPPSHVTMRMTPGSISSHSFAVHSGLRKTETEGGRMATAPQPRYARAGDTHLAYQTFGEGVVDLVLLPDGLMTIEAIAELPAYARFRDRLARFSRLIILDHRGLGLSDPVTPGTNPSLELWAEDLGAVMDAADSSRAALLGIAEGGFGAAFYAASHPDRVSRLILVDATACLTEEPFAPWGTAPAIIGVLDDSIESNWGGNTSAIPIIAPSAADDDSYHAWMARSLRRSASPAVAKALFDLQFRSDIRGILSSIRVPTLVIHRAGNRWFSPDHGRYLADHIPEARYIELPGEDHVPYFGDSAAIAAEIEEFV